MKPSDRDCDRYGTVPLATDRPEFNLSGNTQRWLVRSVSTEPVLRLMFDAVTGVPTISVDSTAAF